MGYTESIGKREDQKMCKNKVQFQTGYSLTDLFREYGTESQCENTLLSGAGRAGLSV